jgi:hypothetical protein
MMFHPVKVPYDPGTDKRRGEEKRREERKGRGENRCWQSRRGAD